MVKTHVWNIGKRGGGIAEYVAFLFLGLYYRITDVCCFHMAPNRFPNHSAICPNGGRRKGFPWTVQTVRSLVKHLRNGRVEC